MKELKENYLIYKLKLKDFEFEDNDEKYTYNFNIIADERIKKIDKNKIMKRIENYDKLQEDELSEKIEEQIQKIKDKILVDIEREHKIIVRDTELIRIIKALRLDKDKDYEFEKEREYTFIEDLISVSISIPMYKKLEDEKISGEIEFNGDVYKRILASAGNVRNKKVIFIKKKLYDKAMEILLVGIDKDAEHKQLSKYNAYIGLVNSDTVPVSEPRIVVIDDFKNTIIETFDIVTKTKEGKFEVENNVEQEFTLMPFDGAGIVDVRQAVKWTKELGILKRDKDGKLITNENGDEIVEYIPSSFQFRQSIGLKGNLYVMDIKAYVKKVQKENGIENIEITDVWGDKHKIVDEDGNLLIDAILTKSQFKFKDYYSSFTDYKEKFDEVLYGYERTFNIAKIGNMKNEDKAMLSYQPIQTLELNNEDIKELCFETLESIRKISTDVDEFIKFRGIDSKDKDKNKRIPPYYKALKNNKDLFYNDTYIRQKVNADIKKIKENACKGDIIIDGNYQTLTPDLIAFMEYATRQEVKGRVKAHDVYCKYWKDKNVKKIDIIRFPHISMEHCIANVIQEEIKEFEYINDGIILSIHDSYLERLGNANEDGDRVLSTNNNLLCERAEEQKTNTILFNNNYEADDTDEEKTVNKISDIDKLIEIDCNGMRASIGEVVNKISVLWSMKKSEQRDKYIKIMMVVGCLVIDFVKTGILEKVPEEILDFLKDNEFGKILKPEFMKIKYKKIEQKKNRKNKNIKLFGDDNQEEVFNNNDCTMNRLYNYMTNEIEKLDAEIKEKTNDDDIKNAIKDTDMLKLIDGNVNEYNKTYKELKETVTKLKAEHDEVVQKNSIEFNNEMTEDKKMEVYDKYNYLYGYYKNEILNIISNNKQVNKEKLLDYMIYMFYLDKDFNITNEDKSLLWNLFGGELNKRLINKSLKDRELDEEFLKRKEKLKDKKDKIVKKASYIYIENIELSKEVGKYIEVYKDNIFKKIDKCEIKESSKKLLKALILLEMIYDNFDMNLIIYQHKKGRLSRSILAKITGLNITKIDESLKELQENKLIQILLSDNKMNLLIEVIFKYKDVTTGNIVKIASLDSLKKYIV